MVELVDTQDLIRMFFISEGQTKLSALGEILGVESLKFGETLSECGLAIPSQVLAIFSQERCRD